ncbi:MAG: PEF-CTERM sorting domain-containing protein [Methanomethylovorans sp.]|uniref:PEF-CTERM sorting domain-containing protein n=1 Tax=Methanomethylovorans sp. TaxID=2758717 RepID=UPI000A55285E|nr:PEF-CTERM sorting domain-containing protein [Methanomethylovorans sp.]
MRNIIIGILLTALLLITAASAAPGDEDEELAVAGIGEFGGSSVAPMCTTYTYPFDIKCDTNHVCITVYGKGSITAYSASGTLLNTVSFNRGGEACITSPAATPIARIVVSSDSSTRPRNLKDNCGTNKWFPINCETNTVCIEVRGSGSILAYDTNGNIIDSQQFTNCQRYTNVCVTSDNAPIARIKVVGASATRNLTYECNPVTPDPDPTPEIPEFPTIALPMAAILGLAFVFMRRKN